MDFVLKKYGAKSIEQIASFDLSEVFSELLRNRGGFAVRITGKRMVKAA